MEEFCQRQQIVQNRIFTPKCGEICDATLETHIYHVKLNDELVSSLQFQRVKEYELAWVDSIIKSRKNEKQDDVTPLATSSVDVGYSLHRIPKELLKNYKRHKTVFVNEPKLSDLKEILLKNQIQAEFNGGVLVCNGIIALKKVLF